MKKHFHESKVILDSSKERWTSVSSLNIMEANAINHSCELAIVDLYNIATNEQFPKDNFIPHHKPLSYTIKLNIFNNYSLKTQSFLEKLNGFALDEARYIDEQAYKDYTNIKSKNKGMEIIKGAETFLEETITLSKNEEVLNKIRKFKK